jgi:hypothetical protein
MYALMAYYALLIHNHYWYYALTHVTNVVVGIDLGL